MSKTAYTIGELDNDTRKRGKILISHLCDFSYIGRLHLVLKYVQ